MSLIIISSNDGETLRLDNPDRAREYRFGGIDQPSLAFLLQVKDLFVYLGGNLDSLGGLALMILARIFSSIINVKLEL